jgi:hypothetical protein
MTSRLTALAFETATLIALEVLRASPAPPTQRRAFLTPMKVAEANARAALKRPARPKPMGEPGSGPGWAGP